ncbi:MAG: hypothetical protein NWQ38_02685 [Cellulophaga sp.]|nr:hypothetical protein [Cellulophaga sp.]
MIYTKKTKLLFFTLVLSATCWTGFSQDSHTTFVAETGDGIITVLRREGLDIKKNYQKFIELNQDEITNGSLLQLGKTYKIPESEFSFSNMGKVIKLTDNNEFPIFDTRLSNLSKKDSTLKNTVYYLLLDRFEPENLQVVKKNEEVRKDVALTMSKQLLEQGARVFLFEYNSDEDQNLGAYIDAINKRFFKFRGAHQRLLVLDIDYGRFNKNAAVVVAHNENSKEGEQFASSIENILKQKKMKVAVSGEKQGIFTDKINLFIANNALPPMTFVKLDGSIKPKEDIALVKQEKDAFIDVITKGIQVDYSTITIEE